MFHPYFTWTNNPVAPVAVSTSVGGVGRKRRPLVIRMAEVQDRQDTAEFLKEQLRLQHKDLMFVPGPAKIVPKETQAQRVARERLAAETLRGMEIEQKEETAKRLVATNNDILTLLLLADL